MLRFHRGYVAVYKLRGVRFPELYWNSTILARYPFYYGLALCLVCEKCFATVVGVHTQKAKSLFSPFFLFIDLLKIKQNNRLGFPRLAHTNGHDPCSCISYANVSGTPLIRPPTGHQNVVVLTGWSY